MGMDKETLAFKCNLIANAFNLPVFFVNTDGKVIFENLNNHLLNPIYENQKEKFFNPLNFDAAIEFEFPVIKKTALSEKYIQITVNPKETFEGTVLIGPTLSFPLTEDRISGIINDTRAFFLREQVIQYYKSITVIPANKLGDICVLAFHLFNKQLISPKSVIYETTNMTDEKMEKINLAVSENLQTHDFHHDQLFEKKILYIVKEGKLEDLRDLTVEKEEEVASILSKSSYLRSIKNHIITLITLVSRASIEGGVHEEIAFSLHDSFIQQLEELDRLDEVRSLAKDVLYSFTKKVREVMDEKHSKTITSCKNYISKHIYEDINHEDIANYVDLSPKYLSILFKKEVGMTVSEYFQYIKIDEAKKLLAYSKTPISEICSLLNYNDQSYFTKVFKKIVQVTPKQYRETYHLLRKK